MRENRFTVGDDGNLALKQDTATYTQRQQTAQDNTPTGGPREVLSFPESEDAIYDGRIRFVVHEAVPLNVSAVNALKKVQDKSEEFTTRAAQRIATASIRKRQVLMNQRLNQVKYNLYELKVMVDWPML